MMSGTNIISMRKGLPSKPGSAAAAWSSIVPPAVALDVVVDGEAGPGAALGISCKAKAKMVLHEGFCLAQLAGRGRASSQNWQSQQLALGGLTGARVTQHSAQEMSLNGRSAKSSAGLGS